MCCLSGFSCLEQGTGIPLAGTLDDTGITFPIDLILPSEWQESVQSFSGFF
jgi:hypothetical protein